LHVNEGSYLAHTQGKKHQTNLARRAAQHNKSEALMIKNVPEQVQVKKKVFVKIGRPGELTLPLENMSSRSLGLC
jgi:splicing factor 3A subunit 2